MISFDKVKEGDVLYDCHKTRMGNTMAREISTYVVKVLEKHPDHCVVSVAGNPARKYFRRSIERLRRSPVKGKGR